MHPNVSHSKALKPLDLCIYWYSEWLSESQAQKSCPKTTQSSAITRHLCYSTSNLNGMCTLWLFDPYWGPACGPFACGWPLELQSTSEVHLSSATSDRSWHGEMLANISDHWLTLAKPPKLEILECEKGTVFVKGFSMIGSLRQLHLAKHGRSAQAAAGQIIIVQKQTTPVAIENKATKRIAWV